MSGVKFQALGRRFRNLFIYFILIEYEYIAIKIIVYFFDMQIALHAETGKKQLF